MEEILTEDTTTTATTTTSSNSLDAIVISTPTSTHESLIWQAAKHQISVFTETPVGETAEQIETLFRIASKAQIHLCCGFQRRFDPSYVSAAQAIAKGKIGKPVVANLFFAGMLWMYCRCRCVIRLTLQYSSLL